MTARHTPTVITSTARAGAISSRENAPTTASSTTTSRPSAKTSSWASPDSATECHATSHNFFSATGGRGIKSLLFPGLLSSRHMNVELRKTLEHCANPSSSSDGTRIAAGDKIKKRVRYIIIGMQCVNSFACDEGLRLAQGGNPHRQEAQVRGEHRPHLSLFIT